MLRSLALMLFVSACATTAPAPAKNLIDPCSEAAPATRAFNVGVAHVAGTYPTMLGNDSFLLEGAQRVQSFGASTIKVYLTPNFREKYHEEWPVGIASVEQLAKTESFTKLFAMPFDTFVLTTYTFANGNDGGFSDGATQAELDAEYDEVRALATHLLKTYAGSGKRFILQNWEADWAVRPNAALVAPQMAKWMQTRQQAVSDARVAAGADGVTVLNAFEVNVVLENAELKVTEAVLPQLCVDAVSYSSWESFIPMHAQSDTAEDAVSRMESALGTIRAAMKKPSLLYLGELGFAESEMDEPRESRITQVLSDIGAAAPRLGLDSAIYWQVFDNECAVGGKNCRGFWLVRPDGELSGAGRALLRLQQKPGAIAGTF